MRNEKGELIKQTGKDETWIDETGAGIPYNRTGVSERYNENKAFSILNQAKGLNEKLKAFKELVAKISEEGYEIFLKENNGKYKRGKGNYTWFNFDRSVKIEVSINESIKFDERTIALAQEKLEVFVRDNTIGLDEAIRNLILDAFRRTKKQLDTRKVLGLTRYRSTFSEKKYPAFHESLDLIEKSIRRDGSKTYFRIWERAENGEYLNVDLNFSSI
jgi:hypothetical protein